MRKVVYTDINKNKELINKLGYFHEFIVRHRLFYESRTFAIIETQNGMLKEIPIGNIKFVEEFIQVKVK